MTITVQAQMACGTWGVRNAFVPENKLVMAGAMKKEELIAKARAMVAKWQTYQDGKQLRVHDSDTDPKVARKQPASSAEIAARALGWMTEAERHGVDDHHGVVHRDGRWAPDWELAIAGFPSATGRDCTVNIHKQVAQFAAEWERSQGYKPAVWQKAIAMQRLKRGETVQQIIDALLAMRVSQ